MSEKKYYSIRTEKHSYNSKLNLPMLLRLFRILYDRFTGYQYFNEAFGTYHDESGLLIHFGGGYLDWDMEAVMFEVLRKSNLWPIEEKCSDYSEEDLFDVIEFLYVHVSKPTKRYPNPFDREVGREEFQEEINKFLHDYEGGYELSDKGEIYKLPDIGLEPLMMAELPCSDLENIDSRVEEAKRKFTNRHSTLEDRRDAIRSLSDVLEFIRPQLKKVLTKKDDGTLFQIANEFGIRHHNNEQKTDYEKSIWYSWMFYYYLATIHAVNRLIKKDEENIKS